MTNNILLFLFAVWRHHQEAMTNRGLLVNIKQLRSRQSKWQKARLYTLHHSPNDRSVAAGTESSCTLVWHHQCFSLPYRSSTSNHETIYHPLHCCSNFNTDLSSSSSTIAAPPVKDTGQTHYGRHSCILRRLIEEAWFTFVLK